MRFAFNPFSDKLDITGIGPGATSVDFITGNSGGTVAADASFNINVIGDNTSGINTIGNLSPNTLTIFGLASSTSQIGTTRYATNLEASAQSLGTVALTPANITSLFSVSPLPASQGGTGLSSPAAHQLVATNGSSAFTPLGVASNGQIPIGSIGSDPVLANITSSGGTITVTNGPGTINLDLSGGSVGVDSFSPDTGTDPVVPTVGGLVDIQGQATPNVSGIQVTGGLNRLDFAMFSPFGGGNFGFSTSNNGGTQTVFTENTSNTASSDATFSAIVGGTSGGDPYSHWVIPATRFYAAGIDNSDSDTWKLTTDVSPVSPSTGTTLLSMTSSGAVTIPTLTGILIGNGASAISANTVTNHNVLVGGTSNAITSVAPSATSGVPLISQGAAADPAFGTAVVAGGGTGVTSFTTYAPVCGGTTTTGVLQSASTGQSTSGFVLTSTGASSLPTFQSISATGAFDQTVIKVYSANDTYTPTSGMKYCIVELVGGGGGGGGNVNAGANQATAGGGGGGGGYARSVFSAATIGASQTVTIGAAGTAGANTGAAGGTGGTTSLGALISATGGVGGAGSAVAAVANAIAGGAGGTGTGTFAVDGTPGGASCWCIIAGISNGTISGYGGNSFLGVGGIARATSVAGIAGAAGSKGGGGSGGIATGATGAQTGGAGGAGYMVITEFLSV